jgi:carbon storage regulator
MFVLSRKQTQSILIVDDIEITVVQIHGNQVRIGINAPMQVSILRSELKDPIDRDAKRIYHSVLESTSSF